MLRIAGSHLERAIDGYRWMCEMMLEEELYFRRTGTYRHQSFADVAGSIYGDPDVMRRYMDGLLLSQAVWPNHVEVFRMYRDVFLPAVKDGRRHLEVGPGHGLLLSYACRDLRGDIEAWDLSPSALEITRQCLAVLNPGTDVRLRQGDFLRVAPKDAGPFDSVVMSELLEHLEAPADALRNIRALMAPGSLLFVNVPVNSPSIDHIFHFRAPAEIAAMIEACGFSIEQQQLAPSSGYSLEKAMVTQTTISCAFVATNTGDERVSDGIEK